MITSPALLSCPKCGTDLNDDLAPPGAAKACPSCERPIEGLLFPAYYRTPAAGRTAEALIAAEDAGCFYHPDSRAEVPCDLCGRFLCALCDVNLLDRHFCPSCVETGRKKKKINHLENSRILYGNIALILAVLPLIALWPSTIITGPLSVLLAIYGWRKPQGLTGVKRTSFVLAIIIGLAETAGWVLMLFGLFRI